jgi:hypothetical protein
LTEKDYRRRLVDNTVHPLPGYKRVLCRQVIKKKYTYFQTDGVLKTVFFKFFSSSKKKRTIKSTGFLAAFSPKTDFGRHKKIMWYFSSLFPDKIIDFDFPSNFLSEKNIISFFNKFTKKREVLCNYPQDKRNKNKVFCSIPKDIRGNNLGEIFIEDICLLSFYLFFHLVFPQTFHDSIFLRVQCYFYFFRRMSKFDLFGSFFSLHFCKGKKGIV